MSPISSSSLSPTCQLPLYSGTIVPSSRPGPKQVSRGNVPTGGSPSFPHSPSSPRLLLGHLLEAFPDRYVPPDLPGSCFHCFLILPTHPPNTHTLIFPSLFLALLNYLVFLELPEPLTFSMHTACTGLILFTEGIESSHMVSGEGVCLPLEKLGAPLC